MKNPTNIQAALRDRANRGVWNPLLGTARMTYDFGIDGGAIGLITPQNSPMLPAGAIILGGVIDVITAVTSGGLATISIGTSAGSSAASLKAASAIATEFDAGLNAIIPVFTVATMIKLTAAGQITLTVAAFVLTAGKFNVDLLYLDSELT